MDAAIKTKRVESILLELIPEALGQLNDARLHELVVLDVKCSRGKSDAKVYLDNSDLSEDEQKKYLSLLSRAKSHIESYCAQDQGWFKPTKFAFIFDDSIQKTEHLEELFKKIATKE